MKILLVDQVYDPDTGAFTEFSGYNQSSFTVYTSSARGVTDGIAARVIQLKKWDNDPQGREFAIRTFIHEIGHSWNSLDAPTQGVASTPWLQWHQFYFTQFMRLSGWSSSLGDGGLLTWTHTADPMDDFVRDYSTNNPNEDWADTFELASRPNLNLNDLSATLRAKVRLVQEFLRLVIPSEAELGPLVFEGLSAPQPNT